MGKIFEAYKTSIFIFIGVIVGTFVGIVMGEKASLFQPISDLFLNLLFTIVVPLVFTSIVASVSKMGDLQRLGKMLGWILGICIFSGIVNALFMMGFMTLWDPTKGAVIEMVKPAGDLNVSKNFLAVFTVSDYPLLWSRTNMMALIVFAILFGIGIIQIKEKGNQAAELIDSLSQVCIKLIAVVMVIAPFGLAAFFAVLIGQIGQDIVGPFANALVMYIAATVIHIGVFYSLFAYIGGGAGALSVYWKEFLPPALTALGTSSSAASMPIGVVHAKKMGIPDHIVDISFPIFTNLRKDGGAQIAVLKIMFMAGIYQMNIWTPENIMLTIIAALLCDMVTSAIPGGGFIGEMTIIPLFGWPIEAIPVMVLLGTITDPFATVTNVVGHSASAMLLARFVEGKEWFKKALQKPAVS